MHDLEKIVTKFEKIVSIDFCHCLAKRVGFIKRSTSQVHGHEFAQAMMIPNAFLEAETLDTLSIRMRKINKACDISASALAQRINTEGAKKFMQGCFGKVFKDTLQNEYKELGDLPNLSKFKRVLIEDSTKWQLNEKLSSHFKGCGGAASKAEIKINFIFNYLSEKFLDFQIVSGATPDQAISNRIFSVLEKGDLLIRDLGYYVLARIKKVELVSAYYVSRFKVNELVFESADSKKPIDLSGLIERNGNQGIIDIVVYLGKEKHPVRLVACALNEEIINKRLREAYKAAKRRGTQVSKKKLNLLKYAIFITNISVEVLCAEAVMSIYRARWRIELIFKQWKSCLKIHLFKGHNKERLYCFLYGRLIMILLLGAMTCILMQSAITIGRELSSFKFTKYMIADHAFAIALQYGRIQQFIERLLQDLPRLCQNKRKRPSLRSSIKMGQNYYNHKNDNELNVKLAA